MLDAEVRADPVLLEPLRTTSWKFYVLIAILGSVVAWGVYAYSWQLRTGLSMTGLNDRVSWGVYISNFVFFIGISHAGTLISAILRVTHAEWRRPITRMAESITVMAIIVGAAFPLIDLGRPDRFLNIFLYGRLESAILWDFISIATYLAGSLLYLYLPMIPDLAIVRRQVLTGRLRSFLYRRLGRGWTGTAIQKRSLEKSIGMMAIIIIPVAISVHTVVSWIFGMTLRVGWHSAIFGPYFVAGAIFSGIATILIAMAIFRRVYHLEKYITLQHFRKLGALLLVLDLIMIYFTLSEYLTAAYGSESQDVIWLQVLLEGPYALMFWGMIGAGFILPAILLVSRRSIWQIVTAAVLVDVAMWMERFLIVVPSMVTPQMTFSWNQYSPSWVEWSITAAAFAGFALLYALFSKFFPIISMWEVSEGAPEAAEPEPAIEGTTA